MGLWADSRIAVIQEGSHSKREKGGALWVRVDSERLVNWKVPLQCGYVGVAHENLIPVNVSGGFGATYLGQIFSSRIHLIVPKVG